MLAGQSRSSRSHPGQTSSNIGAGVMSFVFIFPNNWCEWPDLEPPPTRQASNGTLPKKEILQKAPHTTRALSQKMPKQTQLYSTHHYTFRRGCAVVGCSWLGVAAAPCWPLARLAAGGGRGAAGLAVVPRWRDYNGGNSPKPHCSGSDREGRRDATGLTDDPRPADHFNRAKAKKSPRICKHNVRKTKQNHMARRAISFVPRNGAVASASHMYSC
jgi:hypothetical protein